MASYDVTSIFGRTRLFLPLILIFFIAAGSALACPQHTGRVSNRTRTISTRNVSYMTPVVISYGGRCADDRSSTRRVKYVSMRDNGYYEGDARYVAVRRSVPRTRYVAVRDYDYDDAPRYVSVRRQPAYVDYGTRYVSVRRQPVYTDYGRRYVTVENYAPRQRVVAVHHKAIGDVSYVAVQRIPAVDDYYDRIPRTRAVAVRSVRNSCACPVALRGDLDDVETSRVTRIAYRNDDEYSSGVRHIVVKTDDIDGTEEVIYSGSNYDDSAHVNLPYASVPVTDDVSYNDIRDVDLDNHAAMYNDVAYVPDNDVDTACLPEAFVPASHDRMSTRTISYAPEFADDDSDVIGGDDAAYVADDVVAPPIRYVSSVDDSGVLDADTIYVGDDDAICPEDDADFDRVSYVPADDVDDVDVMPANYTPVETDQYVPVENVTFVPVNSVDTDACACESMVSELGDQPVSFIDEPGIPVDTDVGTVADLDETMMDAEIYDSEYVPYTDSF